MVFQTGLFLLRTSFIREGTAAWAECAVDLMDQPVLRFHYVSADGYGKDSYGWHDNLWLRVDRTSDALQLVIEMDGEWSVEDQVDIDDELQDALADLRGGAIERGAEAHLLSLVLRATGSAITIEALDEGTVNRLDGEPVMHLASVAAERDRRGVWDVTELPGSG